MILVKNIKLDSIILNQRTGGLALNVKKILVFKNSTNIVIEFVIPMIEFSVFFSSLAWLPQDSSQP